MIRCGENTVERKILIAVAQNGNSLNTQNQSSRKVLGLVQEHRSPSDKIGLLLVFSIRAPQQDQENTQTPIEIDRHFPWHRHAGDPLHGERQDSKSDTEKRRQVDQGAEPEPTLSRKTPRARTARHVHVADRRHWLIRRSMVAPAMPDFHVAPGPPTGTGGLAVSSPSSSSTLLSSHCRCPPLRRFWSHFCTGVQS